MDPIPHNTLSKHEYERKSRRNMNILRYLQGHLRRHGQNDKRGSIDVIGLHFRRISIDTG